MTRVNQNPDFNDFGEQAQEGQGDTSTMEPAPPAGPQTSPFVYNKHEEEDFTPLSAILDLQDFPRKFRTALRVVKYEPADVRMWVRAYCEECNKM